MQKEKQNDFNNITSLFAITIIIVVNIVISFENELNNIILIYAFAFANSNS